MFSSVNIRRRDPDSITSDDLDSREYFSSRRLQQYTGYTLLQSLMSLFDQSIKLLQ